MMEQPFEIKIQRKKAKKKSERRMDKRKKENWIILYTFYQININI